MEVRIRNPMHCSHLVKIMLLIMYLWGAHTLTAVVHLCINISLCLCDTVRRQQVYAVQHNRYAECREWWTSLFAENIWHTSVCSVACKDGAVGRSSASICICSKCCSLHTPRQRTWKYRISKNGCCNCFGIYSFFTLFSKLTASTELLFRLSYIILVIVRFIFVVLRMQEFQYME